jgi:hypothetical protein
MIAMVFRVLTLGTLVVLLASAVVPAADDWKAVEDAFGIKGAAQPEGVFRLSFPRRDLSVTVANVPIRATFALGSYAVFKRLGDGTEALMMGDLVLRDEEVPMVMSRLLERGLGVTAVHNHLNAMSPHVMYMHYHGHGEPGAIARALREAIAPVWLTGPTGGGTPALGSLPTRQIEAALGRSGSLNADGVFQISVPRAERISDGGVELAPAMGVATAINFQPTADGKAAITGDFVLIGSEVNRVAAALRKHGIDVTALHNHGLADEPRLFYMHFWANDDAVTLARGLRAALEQTNSAPLPAGK